MIAVSEGPFLSSNLLACVHQTGQLRVRHLSHAVPVAHVTPAQSFSSRKNRLQLLMTGDHSAVGCLGPVSFQGDWVWRWKDFLDRQWLELYDMGRLRYGSGVGSMAGVRDMFVVCLMCVVGWFGKRTAQRLY